MLIDCNFDWNSKIDKDAKNNYNHTHKFLRKQQLKTTKWYAKLLLTCWWYTNFLGIIWWYEVEKRLGTPGIDNIDDSVIFDVLRIFFWIGASAQVVFHWLLARQEHVDKLTEICKCHNPNIKKQRPETIIKTS